MPFGNQEMPDPYLMKRLNDALIATIIKIRVSPHISTNASTLLARWTDLLVEQPPCPWRLVDLAGKVGILIKRHSLPVAAPLMPTSPGWPPPA